LSQPHERDGPGGIQAKDPWRQLEVGASILHGRFSLGQCGALVGPTLPKRESEMIGRETVTCFASSKKLQGHSPWRVSQTLNC
jgi:hypothetical protein